MARLPRTAPLTMFHGVQSERWPAQTLWSWQWHVATARQIANLPGMLCPSFLEERRYALPELPFAAEGYAQLTHIEDYTLLVWWDASVRPGWSTLLTMGTFQLGDMLASLRRDWPDVLRRQRRPVDDWRGAYRFFLQPEDYVP